MINVIALLSNGLMVFVTIAALMCDLKVPRWDFQTGRQLRTSPLYDRLDAQGARWMEKHGFERVKYFVPPGKGEITFSSALCNPVGLCKILASSSL